ncbi:flagellar basal body rod protein FlgB [Hankyongella ginsenosidimutans]|uniref:Flagellar basal body rod protein FlgB n=1 Tax=Hankyongella ginsenosidimutans TaxID=1763828 RepID=A0A4D7CBV9_9SPHN|nr:flagellar basal body rod protein FlgB [Hankyongella ginsenosidimutans]QCI80286.1 flagellar basal body rod protein FlgB [Hankyongella ginsenosidimutans]TXG83900.1 MAG: flagellar basal body rod protein FlgB [Sphingomonadales bacterium]
MDPTDLPLFSAMAYKLRYLNARQAVTSTNLANADTPDYKARKLADVDFKDVLNQLNRQPGTPSVTRPRIAEPAGLLALRGEVGANFGSELDESATETKPNGNNVALEDQLIDIADVQMQYSLMTNLMRKNAGLLRLALGRNGG